MKDLKWDVPSTDEIEVDDETLAALERGREDYLNGRTFSIEEVRQLIPKWISEFASRKQR